MKTAIIGLGYVGLPLALLAAEKGLNVLGVDKDTKMLSDLEKKKTHLNDDIVLELLPNVSFKVSTKVDTCDSYIVCVPTPVNEQKNPDLKYVISACKEISKVLRDGQLVVIESTINPGICEQVVKPILDQSGKEYYLCHCPERINPGDKRWNVRNIPRVIGGITLECANKGKDLYSNIIDGDITVLSQIRAAEATKILENTFRDVNIAFINEMAMSFHLLGIDIAEVIKGASTKPFAFMPHYPGVGVGGHCIAVDPYYMINRGKEVGFTHDFLIAARRINSYMPSFTVSVLQDALNEVEKSIKGSRVAILGVSYKPNIADNRESPFYEVYNLLVKKGADICVFDPYYSDMNTHTSLEETLREVDAVLIVTAHEAFKQSELYSSIPVIIDGRNSLNKNDFINKKIIYKGIGIN